MARVLLEAVARLLEAAVIALRALFRAASPARRGWLMATERASVDKSSAKPAAGAWYKRNWPWWIAVGLGYYAGAMLGYAQASFANDIAWLWPPNAILLAALLRTPPRHWVGYLLAIIPAELAADAVQSEFSIGLSLSYAGINALECALSAAILWRIFGKRFAFEGVRHAMQFILWAVLGVPALAAVLGAYVALPAEGTPFVTMWRIWWLADSLGIVTLTPFILSWWSDTDPWWRDHRRTLEVAAGLLVLVVIANFVFAVPVGPPRAIELKPILVLPLLLWSAVRFGISGTTVAGAVTTLVMLIHTARGQGPYSYLGGTAEILAVQEFLGAVLVVSLVLATLLQEISEQRRQLELKDQAIRASNEGILIAEASEDNPQLVFVNPAFEQMTGYSSAEVVGKDGSYLYGGEESQPGAAKVREALRLRKPVRTTLVGRRKDGGMYWSDLSVAPVRSRTGEVTHFIGVKHDITDLKRTEDALLATQEELRKLNAELEERIGARTRELQQANEALNRLATTDALTGAHNRRYFLSRVAQEVARSKRRGNLLSILILDIDHFKRINDTYGHSVGDECLRQLVATLQPVIRPSDLLCRFGGEEFVVLLPDSDLAAAEVIAERLRESVERSEVAGGGGKIKFTISIGAAKWHPDEQDVDPVLKRADDALYRAKAEGRNLVRVQPRAGN